MSSRTSFTIPVANQLLTPKAASTLDVSLAYDNQHVKHLAVFIHTSLWDLKLRKFMRKVAKPAAEPRSYVVQTGVMEYRRNRRHILAVPEPAPAQSPAAASSPTLSATAPQQPPTLSMLLTGVLPCQIRIYSLSLQFPPRHHQSLESIRRHRQGTLSDPKLHQSSLEKGMQEVPGSNGPAYCNAKRSQVVTRSGRISRLYPKSEEFVT